MDKDGNGYIEKRELKNLLLALGESPTDKDVRASQILDPFLKAKFF